MATNATDPPTTPPIQDLAGREDGAPTATGGAPVGSEAPEVLEEL